jgi:hypothetical protein
LGGGVDSTVSKKVMHTKLESGCHRFFVSQQRVNILISFKKVNLYLRCRFAIGIISGELEFRMKNQIAGELAKESWILPTL